MNDLEQVFSVNHQYHGRIFYDTKAGQYYDLHCDLYLTLDEAHSFGIR
jgi:hypothetical protein